MKGLQVANLIGVLALAGVCAVQWKRDRQLNLEVIRLEKIRLEQSAQLTNQAQSIRGLTADLTEFKERFAQSNLELTELRDKLRESDREVQHLTLEREQLKNSITNWAHAVEIRDDRLKEANAQIQELADKLNSSVRKYNELVTLHNTVVKELNDLRAPPPEKSEKK